MADTP